MSKKFSNNYSSDRYLDSQFDYPYRINYSSSFLFRSRCPKCKDEYYYYSAENHPNLQSVHDYKKNYEWFRAIMTSYRICNSYYLDHEPSSFNSTLGLKFSNYHNNFQIKKLKNKNIKGQELYQVRTCKCGSTHYFSNNTSRHRPEIVHRKSRHSSKPNNR